ncbi:MAG: hypothetical protein ACK5L6_05160 [Anaerorhabdus sp.]|uniref:hypothetical protein n=1 Tax=Anaerorhabdus sp. TaxID=1872524 RepID=UPI003A835BD2
MILEINGKLYAKLSIMEPPIPLESYHPDEMECTLKCPYCGEITKIGETRMISGYVGCDNCYFQDLQPRVLRLHETNYQEYMKGTFYKNGLTKNLEEDKNHDTSK